MPSLMITEEEFLNLTEPTQEELLGLFKRSFLPAAESAPYPSIKNERSEWYAKLEEQNNFFARLRHARSKKATVSYQQYFETLLKLQKELPLALKDQALKPTAISIEMAIGFVCGLNPDSIKVLSKLLNQNGSATRAELEALLKGAGKINGTVGSINRRFAKRFDKRIYGDKLERFKLIEFDKIYSLTCDFTSIDLAIIIIKKGYKIGKGDISLQFDHPTQFNEPKVKTPPHELLIISEDAITSADQGLGFVRNVGWEINFSTEVTNFSHDVALTLPSGTVIVEGLGEHEWINDEGDCLWDEYHPNCYPNKISFEDKTYPTFKQK
ncbi:hypothetical protein OAC90_01470 [Planktomarina sp.]|nr:hypothetical protein [Planktomarina sp.]